MPSMAQKTGCLAKRGESRHHREKIFSNDSFPHQLTVMMCFFFSSHDDARRGWSYCAGQHLGAWRRRWCVLEKPDQASPAVLLYYASHTDEEPRGRIEVRFAAAIERSYWHLITPSSHNTCALKRRFGFRNAFGTGRSARH